ncbi:MAG: MerR family transcriptional regulator [Bacteroidales bacterium]|nr:MerR family transcriptional regulator [Bacteroidales bacterium]
MVLHTNKDLKLYYSISEVAQLFDVAESVLRYWEKMFPRHIKPRKAGRNIRQYTKEDIEQIRTIQYLLKEKGLRIEAARTLLEKNKEVQDQTAIVVDKLRHLRAQLVAMRDGLV